MTTATTHSSKYGNYSSVPRMNYTSDASRTSLGTTGLGRSGSGDHIATRPDQSFAIPLRNSDGGRHQQEAGMSQPTTLSSAIQTPTGGGWNTNYVSQQNSGLLAKTEWKGGGGTTRVSPRVYSTILKHPQGSHQDRMDYSGIPGRPRPMGLCREAQKDQLAAKNAEAGWGSSGGRGGILPGLIGRMPGPPQSLMSLANSGTNFGSSLDENSISATSHRRRSSSIFPVSNPSLAQGDAKPYSELVTRSDKILSEVKKAIRPSLDENFNILGGSSAHTLVSTSPWDANPSDPGIKRQKNEEYRVYLQHQIEEKEKRLEAEKRDTSKHPLGPSYESPSLPYHRQQVSILNSRVPANEAAILKKYIYDNPPHPTRRPSSSTLPVLSPSKSSPNPMPFVNKEKQEEALRNLRQSRLKIYRNAESKDFPNNNYIIPDPHSKSHSPGHSSGSNASSPPAPSSHGRPTLVHTNSRRPAHQTHDNPNVESQTTSQHHHRKDESPSGHLRGGYTQNEVNNNWEGKDIIAEGHNHHGDERDNFAQPQSATIPNPNPTNTGNQMHGSRPSAHPDLQYQQRQFNQPQYAHQQQPVQSQQQQHVSFYSPHHPQTYAHMTPTAYPVYPLPGVLPQPQQYPLPPQMNPYPLPGPPCLPQATSLPATLPQMHTQPSFPQRTMQLARHEANPSEVQTHYRNRNMQEHSMVSFAEANDEGHQERRHRRVENEEDNEISEDVVRSIAEDLKRRTINKQKIWQTSDELPDREVLTVLHKTELKQQIAEKQRQRDEQRRRENAEDAKLDRKIQEYHDELRRRDEEKKYQFQVMRLLEADKKPSLVQIVEPRNPRRVRVYESDTNLRRPKPSTPPIEKYDPEITLAAKLKPGKGHGQAGSSRRGVNKNDGSLPSLGNAFIHPVKSRVISPPVPAVYKKIASGRRLDEEDSYNSKSRNEYPNKDEGGSVFFQQLQDYMRRERADVERNLRQRLDEEGSRRIKKGPS